MMITNYVYLFIFFLNKFTHTNDLGISYKLYATTLNAYWLGNGNYHDYLTVITKLLLIIGITIDLTTFSVINHKHYTCYYYCKNILTICTPTVPTF